MRACGIIAASAGNDLYHPIQAMLIGAVGAVCAYKLHFWVERKFKIDDPVGAVAVHGYAGFIGLVIAGFMLWGHPATAGYHADVAVITPWGQFIGALHHVRRARLHPGLHRGLDPQGHGRCCGYRRASNWSDST